MTDNTVRTEKTEAVLFRLNAPGKGEEKLPYLYFDSEEQAMAYADDNMLDYWKVWTCTTDVFDFITSKYDRIKEGLTSHVENGMVDFNEYRLLGQNRDASKYVFGMDDDIHPALGLDLRWNVKTRRDASNYHFIKIHIDDYKEFNFRVYTWKYRL